MNLAVPILLALAQIDIGEITQTEGIAIHHCHAGDTALVCVQGVGVFTTTNNLLTLTSPPMTMIPNGTNIASVQTVCCGATSGAVHIKFAVRRAVPAPRVARGRRHEIPSLPLPPGLVPALPGGSNQDASYAAYRQRIESGKRRSE